MTSLSDNWIVVRAVANFRIYNWTTCQYHHGSDGAVRVYRDVAPAQRRANILNGILSEEHAETEAVTSQ